MRLRRLWKPLEIHANIKLYRVRERLKETKEAMETMKTSDMQIQNCMERQRLEKTRETMETSGGT